MNNHWPASIPIAPNVGASTAVIAPDSKRVHKWRKSAMNGGCLIRRVLSGAAGEPAGAVDLPQHHQLRLKPPQAAPVTAEAAAAAAADADTEVTADIHDGWQGWRDLLATGTDTTGALPYERALSMADSLQQNSLRKWKKVTAAMATTSGYVGGAGPAVAPPPPPQASTKAKTKTKAKAKAKTVTKAKAVSKAKARVQKIDGRRTEMRRASQGRFHCSDHFMPFKQALAFARTLKFALRTDWYAP